MDTGHRTRGPITQTLCAIGRCTRVVASSQR
jgi:hypothetical protein